MTDKLGQEILPGCYIVYGHQVSASTCLRIGKVIKVLTRQEERLYSDDLYDVHRITVRGVNDQYSSEPRLTVRTGTLQYPDRVVVLPENMIPESYKELLSAGSVKPAAEVYDTDNT